MGLFDSKRNFGFGKHPEFAAGCALRVHYGNGHFATVAKHQQSFSQFCRYVSEEFEIRDMSKITLEHIHSYAEEVRLRVEDELMEVSTAHSRFVGVNVAFEALRGDQLIRIDSPTKIVGQRDAIRRNPPTGLNLQQVKKVTAALREAGLARAAVVVEFCRSFGVRVREAVLSDVETWCRQAGRTGHIDVREGTKGGRGRYVERKVECSEEGLEVLRRALAIMCAEGTGVNLLRGGESFDSFVNDGEINRARRILHSCGIKCFQDLRASWACDEWQRSTGQPAPVFGLQSMIDKSLDKKIRGELSWKLGHRRPGILVSYIGKLSYGL